MNAIAVSFHFLFKSPLFHRKADIHDQLALTTIRFWLALTFSIASAYTRVSS